MARVNYQRDKRLKDLDRQRKQEEKRNRKALKGLAGDALPGDASSEPLEGQDEAPAPEGGGEPA